MDTSEHDQTLARSRISTLLSLLESESDHDDAAQQAAHQLCEALNLLSHQLETPAHERTTRDA